MKNKLIVAAALITVVLAGAFFYNKYPIAPGIKFNSLSLTDLNGKPVNPDEFANKKLFINFFATWCGPCLQEFPALISLQSTLQKENFQFIVVSDEPIARLRTFREQSEIPMTILHSEKSLREHRIFTIPTSYVLNIEKDIVFAKVGVADWTSADMIEKLKAVAN